MITKFDTLKKQAKKLGYSLKEQPTWNPYTTCYRIYQGKTLIVEDLTLQRLTTWINKHE